VKNTEQTVLLQNIIENVTVVHICHHGYYGSTSKNQG